MSLTVYDPTRALARLPVTALECEPGIVYRHFVAAQVLASLVAGQAGCAIAPAEATRLAEEAVSLADALIARLAPEEPRPRWVD